jgi:anti-sigma factor RsiW
MNEAQQLELQAYLDGELSAQAARRVAAWVGRDQEARSLLAELKTTKTALAGNEPEAALPETREFYWSKISRAIQAAEPAEPRPDFGWLLAWRRFLAPVGGLALVALLAFGVSRFLLDDPTRHLVEIENLSEHISSLAYRSQSDNMLVVWIQDRGQNQDEDAAPDFQEDDDIVIQ